jgi:hypothetical protein
MKQIKMYEHFYYGKEGNTQSPSTSSGSFRNWTTPNSGKEAELYFNMLPRGLRNELTRPVKDMLMNTNVKDWHVLDFILPKIEKLMAKSGLQWNRFPGVMRTSGIKNMDQFVNWLKSGYSQALEDAYFS